MYASNTPGISLAWSYIDLFPKFQAKESQNWKLKVMAKSLLWPNTLKTNLWLLVSTMVQSNCIVRPILTPFSTAKKVLCLTVTNLQLLPWFLIRRDIGVVHQIISPISNSESTIFLTNIYYDFYFNWQTEKKHLFSTNKEFVFFFNYLNWEKFVKLIGEIIWWIR